MCSMFEGIGSIKIKFNKTLTAISGLVLITPAVEITAFATFILTFETGSEAKECKIGKKCFLTSSYAIFGARIVIPKRGVILCK